MTNYLSSDHPSYDTQIATFLFSVDDGFFCVIAENPNAVQTVEICDMNDWFMPGVELVAIFRDPGTTGIRSDKIVKIDYPDFLVRIINPECAKSSSSLQECISESLSDEDREKISNIVNGASEEEEEVQSDESDDCTDILIKALSGMGFKMPRVKKFVKTLGPRVKQEPVQSLLREGIKQLAA